MLKQMVLVHQNATNVMELVNVALVVEVVGYMATNSIEKQECTGDGSLC